jgi:hypothetical protein
METKKFTVDGVDYTVIVKEKISIDDVVEHLVRTQLFNIRAGITDEQELVPKEIRDALLKQVL